MAVKEVKEKPKAKPVDIASLRRELKSVVPFGNSLANSEYSKISEWIHTGNYHLNAMISGSLFKGIPSNRSIALVGESGVGKTYLVLNMVREAQKLGYHIIYFDSEGAIDSDTAKSFGVDADKFDLQPVSDLNQFRSAITKIVKSLMDAKKAGFQNPKIMIVLDSLGMLATEKEIEDALSGNPAVDFTKQKAIRSIFRIITSDMTGLGIPFIYTNHVFGGPMQFEVAISGGKGQVYSSSVIVHLTKAKLKEGTEQSGIIITAIPIKNRLAKPKTIKFHLRYSSGMNPYVDLSIYFGWDTCGIERGNILTAKEYSKMKVDDQSKCSEFEFDNEKLYFSPKATAQKFIVKHLGTGVSVSELFNDRVFTPEVLRQIDQKKIESKFKYGVDENIDIEQIVASNSEDLETVNEEVDEVKSTED